MPYALGAPGGGDFRLLAADASRAAVLATATIGADVPPSQQLVPFGAPRGESGDSDYRASVGSGPAVQLLTPKTSAGEPPPPRRDCTCRLRGCRALVAEGRLGVLRQRTRLSNQAADRLRFYQPKLMPTRPPVDPFTLDPATPPLTQT
jgi:hypothetical protein